MADGIHSMVVDGLYRVGEMVLVNICSEFGKMLLPGPLNGQNLGAFVAKAMAIQKRQHGTDYEQI